MQISGLEILDSDGLHLDDDWCRWLVRMRVGAKCNARELRIGVWLPPGDSDAVGSLFTVTAANCRLVARALRFGEGMELKVPIDLSPGAELTFQVDCENVVTEKGADRRQLSFVMTSLVAM
jgi:hypothetical protein